MACAMLVAFEPRGGAWHASTVRNRLAPAPLDFDVFKPTV